MNFCHMPGRRLSWFRSSAVPNNNSDFNGQDNGLECWSLFLCGPLNQWYGRDKWSHLLQIPLLTRRERECAKIHISKIVLQNIIALTIFLAFVISYQSNEIIVCQFLSIMIYLCSFTWTYKIAEEDNCVYKNYLTIILTNSVNQICILFCCCTLLIF